MGAELYSETLVVSSVQFSRFKKSIYPPEQILWNKGPYYAVESQMF